MERTSASYHLQYLTILMAISDLQFVHVLDFIKLGRNMQCLVSLPHHSSLRLFIYDQPYYGWTILLGMQDEA